MLEATRGRFDYAVAMDSLIYYSASDIAGLLGQAVERLNQKFVFTLPPRTPALMVMWRLGKLFPRSDRSPVMVPQTTAGLARALRDARVAGRITEIDRVKSGFYIANLLTFTGGAR
ncbi:MAG: hypothetical protein AAGF56_13760 [Pseudomonadota bacterium]